MFAGLRTARGVVRSLALHYGRRHRAAAMDRLYQEFVKPGDLVIDAGAHVGDRTAAFLRLGATVVAVEPQPALAFTLRALYGRNPKVSIQATAVGRNPGTLPMMINTANPTVSSASEQFVRATHGAAGWERQAWDRVIEVPVTTLDTLIEIHGVPSFIKIDVEGFEENVLAGLSQPIAALSFEFTTIQRDVARACIERCGALGFTQFNATIGDGQLLGAWRPAEAMIRWLGELPHAANSGDVYARMA